MSRAWTEDETLSALALYLQTPYGKIHTSNQDIIELAQNLNRTPSSVSMKMLNLAALNPIVQNSGRVGLRHGSKLDRAVWEEYANDWSTLSKISEKLHSSDDHENALARETHLREELQPYFDPPDTRSTSYRALIDKRKGQAFFRRSVIANYSERCCVTGISEPKLLVASHILPWKESELDRLNPANGLALSATFDRAFDSGLMTITPDLSVRISQSLLNHDNEETRQHFLPHDGKPIMYPERFMPEPRCIEWHNNFFERLEAAQPEVF